MIPISHGSAVSKLVHFYYDPMVVVYSMNGTISLWNVKLRPTELCAGNLLVTSKKRSKIIK
jgi:hypothetical protein